MERLARDHTFGFLSKRGFLASGSVANHGGPPESKTRLLALCTRIDDTRGERNTIAHGLWHPNKADPETGLIQTVNLARNAVVVTELMTRPDLDDLAERIGEIIAELVDVGVNMGWHKPIPAVLTPAHS